MSLYFVLISPYDTSLYINKSHYEVAAVVIMKNGNTLLWTKSLDLSILV